MDEEDHSGRNVSSGSLEDVLASIRALVTAETSSRMSEAEDTVLMLTPDMRIDDCSAPMSSDEHPAAGLEEAAKPRHGAPILDEEEIRTVVNRIVREELQGELGERINRNLRKLIRREIAQLAAERRDSGY